MEIRAGDSDRRDGHPNGNWPAAESSFFETKVQPGVYQPEPADWKWRERPAHNIRSGLAPSSLFVRACFEKRQTRAASVGGSVGGVAFRLRSRRRSASTPLFPPADRQPKPNQNEMFPPKPPSSIHPP